MEFWGVEVEPGKPLKVQPDIGKLIHISQASLGELKDVKGIKNVPLRLKIDHKNFIIGNLSPEDRPQLIVDLVFEKEFELSHDLKNGSVYFIGYVADDPVSDDEFDDDDEVFPDFDEDEPVDLKENGKVKLQDVKAAKKILAAAGGNGKAEAKKEDQSDSDDDDEEEDSDEDDDDEMAIDGIQGDDSDLSGQDSEDDSDEEEETPKVQPSKKRPVESVQKSPAAKKAKAATPEKTGKKGQAATPTPAKAAGNKSKEQTPKSGGQISCKSCSKTFTSANALQSHSKAKHEGK